MTILKVAAAQGEPINGTWLWVQMSDGRKVVMITCPGCGQFCALTGHGPGKDSEDGGVSPSVDHSRAIKFFDQGIPKLCGFHDMIKLEGWEKKNAE